jgi:hypothetical protein
MHDPLCTAMAAYNRSAVQLLRGMASYRMRAFGSEPINGRLGCVQRNSQAAGGVMEPANGRAARSVCDDPLRWSELRV